MSKEIDMSATELAIKLCEKLGIDYQANCSAGGVTIGGKTPDKNMIETLFTINSNAHVAGDKILLNMEYCIPLSDFVDELVQQIPEQEFDKQMKENNAETKNISNDNPMKSIKIKPIPTKTIFFGGRKNG